MRIGYVEKDITPVSNVHLGGFAHRKGTTKDIHLPLTLKVIAFDNKYLFVADLLWWDDNLVKQWKKRLALKNIEAVFSATHTHSSPNIHRDLYDVLGVVDEYYIQFLDEQIATSIVDLVWQTATYFQLLEAPLTVACYRRKMIDGKIQMAPNEEIEVDLKISLIFLSEGSQNRLLLLHLACHPTVSDENVISSEFCGYVSWKLQLKYGLPVIVLQGFCGDIRPKLIRNHKFYRGNRHDIEKIGEKIINDLENLKLVVDGRLLDVPLFNDAILDVPIKRMYEPKVESPQYKKSILPFRTSKLTIANELSFIFANAEMSHDYQKKIGDLGVAYTDGMIGYVATEKQIIEGGYEGLEFIYAFGNRGPFPVTMEKQILELWKGWSS